MNRIVIIGVGGSGIRTVNRLATTGSGPHSYVAIDVDPVAIERCDVSTKILLPSPPADDPRPDSVRTVLDERLRPVLERSAAAILVGNPGGNTASRILPLVARFAREMGVPVFAVVIRPTASEETPAADRSAKSLAEVTSAAALIASVAARRAGPAAAADPIAPIAGRLTGWLAQNPPTRSDIGRLAGAIRTSLERDTRVLADGMEPRVTCRPYRLPAVDAAAIPDTGPARGGNQRFLARRRSRSEPTARPRATRSAQPAAPTDEPTAGTPDRSAAEPAAITDAIHFTITTPCVVAPGAFFVLGVWAHLGDRRDEVIALARQAAAGGDVLARGKGPIHVTRGSLLTVRLNIDGVQVDDPEDVLLWEGETANADFPVRVPADAASGATPGTVTIHAGGIRIARVHFALEIGSRTGEVAAEPVDVLRYRKAFASYASEDRALVMGRIQGMHEVAPNLDVFVDVVSLRSGQPWEQELYRRIPENDVFYLFWSENARRSEWVEKEWRCALDAKGITFIDPVPLVSPDVAPPPPELAALHFNDWHLAFMAGPSSPTSASPTR